MHIHDLIGIGFGPSNIALAIALQEEQQLGQRHLDAFFVEKQPSFAWHPGMLLDHAHMQISYLKDLATLRNPRSRFTFVNYLHEQGRLPDFINLKTFFPSRREFSDYLDWAACHFDDICAYGEEVFDILPEQQHDGVQFLRVRSRDSNGKVQERLARNLVVSVGGTPQLPECFHDLAGDARVFHSNSYLKGIAANRHARKIAVIGAGQSAAEIFIDLHNRPEPAQVDLIMRGRAIHPSDDSPFVNGIFNADYTDHIYQKDDATRAELLAEFHRTNYAAPDLALVQQIFKIMYEQRLVRGDRHHLLPRHEIRRVTARPDGIDLGIHDLEQEMDFTSRYDAVVLATGYERQYHRKILGSLGAHLGDFVVDRDYRLLSAPAFQPKIFLQGACENSHGLSDTLLSVTAVRVKEIIQALAPAAATASAPLTTTTPAQVRTAAIAG